MHYYYRRRHRDRVLHRHEEAEEGGEEMVMLDSVLSEGDVQSSESSALLLLESNVESAEFVESAGFATQEIQRPNFLRRKLGKVGAFLVRLRGIISTVE